MLNAALLLASSTTIDAKRLRIDVGESQLMVRLGERGIDRSGAPRREVRLSDGTRLIAAFWQGTYSEFVCLPPFRAGTSRPVGYALGEWRKDASLFPSEADQKAASNTNIGQMRALVSAGDHALAVVDWVNTSQSGRPTYYQHLVSISAEGTMKPLRALGRPPGRYGSPERLWRAGKRLFLHVGTRLEAIGPNGEALKKVADLPEQIYSWSQFAEGRWIAYQTGNEEPSGPLWLLDTTTCKLSTFTPPKDVTGSFSELDPYSPHVLYRDATSVSVCSVATGKSTRIPFAGLDAFVWNGLVFLSRSREVKVYDPATGKLLRTVKSFPPKRKA
ncbi:hypothetical protein EON81_07540 [bacterium]|nr:MAG: hypothetical protein EON81_07540 [bacterium]